MESQGCLEEAQITTGWKNTVRAENVGKADSSAELRLFALASYQLHYCCLFEFGHLMLYISALHIFTILE